MSKASSGDCAGHVAKSDSSANGGWVYSAYPITEREYIKQPNHWTCGPATYCMLLRALKLVAPSLEKTSQFLNCSEEDGTSSADFAHALVTMNSFARTKTGKNADVALLRELLKDNFAICIIFREPKTKQGHFALVHGISSDCIELCDPDCGMRFQLPLEQFDWRTGFESPQKRGWYFAASMIK